jgi:hypothetical protein
VRRGGGGFYPVHPRIFGLQQLANNPELRGRFELQDLKIHPSTVYSSLDIYRDREKQGVLS